MTSPDGKEADIVVDGSVAMHHLTQMLYQMTDCCAHRKPVNRTH
jgi:hypothetical protein